MLRLSGGGVTIFCKKKNEQERCRNEGREEEGKTPYHKLNIIDGLIDEHIMMVTLLIILSIKIPRHRTIYLLAF